MQFRLESLCRLNGAEPTLRERWTAFYRLWRMASRTATMHMNHEDCFRLLYHGGVEGQWLSLILAGDYLTMPLCLRLHRLREMRRMKLATRLLQAIFTEVDA